MIQQSFYKYLSLIKLVVWALILFIDFVAINVFEDPIVAIWILLIWSFLVAWWASFFFFLFIQKIFKNKKNEDSSPESESYKLSFLFWMYAILNILLIFLWHRSKLWWLILLCWFVLLLYFLMMENTKNVKKTE